MTDIAVKMVQNQWDVHLEKCWQSEAKERYFKQGAALKRGDIELIKQLADEARQQREEDRYMPKPSSYEPRWLSGCWPVTRVKALEVYLDKINDNFESSGDGNAQFMQDLVNSP